MLQPQDKRSRQPGDHADAVAARRRLHQRGFTSAMLDAFADLLRPQPGEPLLDVGCGDGFYLGSLAARSGAEAWGVDLSVPAIQAAARRYPECQWQVANADRALPYRTGAFGAVMSITARLHATDFRRVLRDAGRLLVAVPAPDDLVELRGFGKDRTHRVTEALAQDFTVQARRRVTTTQDLDADAVRDVQLAIYRPLQAEAPTAMQLTFSLDVLLLRVRG
ncbi:MAG: methyltransferase domain-containing protein [Bryobacterales bacterium]|nr:methyltransferase domain-containing protein [Bryobacterales bacterium]